MTRLIVTVAVVIATIDLAAVATDMWDRRRRANLEADNQQLAADVDALIIRIAELADENATLRARLGFIAPTLRVVKP